MSAAALKVTTEARPSSRLAVTVTVRSFRQFTQLYRTRHPQHLKTDQRLGCFFLAVPFFFRSSRASLKCPCL